MEENKGQNSSYRLLKIAVFAIFVVCCVMIGVYGIFLGWKPSGDTGDWGNFGSYLGAITGLLAFSGVLYTASLSEKRAVIRDERDQFFKMLELYKEQVSSVKDQKKTGVEAFEIYGLCANDNLIVYVILKRLIDLKFTLTIENKEEIDIIHSVFNNLKRNINNSNDDEITGYYRKRIYERDLEFIIKESKRFPETVHYFYYLEESMDLNKKYLAMKYVGDLIYYKYGHYLGQYFRTICHLQNMIADNTECEKYIAIFRSQLSRYELILLLYYIVSSQLEPEVAQMFVDNEIFMNIFPEDVISCKNEIDQENDKDKQRAIVNDFIKDLVLIKVEESKNVSNK
jgi:hypothetical protein